MEIEIDYQKYRWFFTSSGLLVIGGKSAVQNEEVIKLAKQDDVILHTSDPGSPFCVIKDEIEETNEDVREAAVFCASLSKAWKSKKQIAEVEIFRKNQVYKTKNMALGTFGIKGTVEKTKVELKLYLDFQEGKLRAVPFETKVALITPGSLSKEKAAEAISAKLEIPAAEVMSALPSEGINIKWL
jgi:hypothetical protein